MESNIEDIKRLKWEMEQVWGELDKIKSEIKEIRLENERIQGTKQSRARRKEEYA